MSKASSSSYTATSNSLFTNIGLSDDCNYLANRVKTQCQANGISNMFPVVMAIMMQESGGHYNTYPDVFQCSESLGKKPNTLSLDESLKQGPKYFSECYSAANQNVEVALQSYNFGIGFAYWAAKNHPGQAFNTSWIRAWKSANNFGSSYGDEQYVAHVKRYYRTSEENVGGGEDDYGNNYSLVGDEGAPYKVFYNPARILKRILKVYRGEGVNSSVSTNKYADYFKEAKIEPTQWVAGLDTKQTNETAAQYINRVLCKNAMTVETDANGEVNYGANYLKQSTGFKYYVNGNGHNFVHIDFEANAANAPTLTYGSKDSTIISFSTGKIGAIAMTGSIRNEDTGTLNVDEAVLDDISGDVFTIGGEKVFGADVTKEQKDKSKEYKNWWNFQISPKNIISSASASGFSKTVADTWSKLEDYTTTAEMTVWGESGVHLEPGGFVNIVVYGNGRKHYSSGCYYITSMEDSISADGYTQTCKMIKNLGNLKVSETGKSLTGVKITENGGGFNQNTIQWETTTTYSDGSSVKTYTPGNIEEYAYYIDLLYAAGWQETPYARQQEAKEKLNSKLYEDISDARKALLKKQSGT